MPKNFFQDIIPPEKRSIRNIPVPKRPKAKEESFKERTEEKTEDFDVPVVYPYEEEKPNRFKNRAIWIASSIAVLIVLFAVISLFSGATVYLSSVEREVLSSADKIYSAKSTPDETSVGYQVVTNTKDLGKTVNATGEEYVEKKASGKIVIYNTFEASPMRLVKNTRFEATEGLVYRVSDSVLIPGRTGTGAQMTPGSIEVMVYADKPGDKYNIGLKDFTIPGFKDTPQYKAVYARSKTEITGGFVGNVKKVSETDLKNAESELESKLRDQLSSEYSGQLPDEYLAFKDGQIFKFESLPQSDQSENTVVINKRGTLNSIIFKKTDLSKYMLGGFGTSSVNFIISNFDNLKFSILNKENYDPAKTDKFNFKIDGEIKFVALVNTDKIKDALAGKPRGQFNEILQDFPEVKRAREVIRPFWKRSFPSDTSKIKIIVEPPK